MAFQATIFKAVQIHLDLDGERSLVHEAIILLTALSAKLSQYIALFDRKRI